MWYSINTKYNKPSDYLKIKQFFTSDSKKLFKKYSSTGSLQYSSYSINKAYSNLLKSRLSQFLLGRFNFYKLLKTSLSRRLLSSYLSQLVFFMKFYTNILTSNSFLQGTKIFNSLLMVFYKKFLVVYNNLFPSKSFSFNFLPNLYTYPVTPVSPLFFNTTWVNNSVKSFYVLYLKVSLNNVFITLTRNGSDVLLSLSGGQTSSKKKKTTLTVFFLLSRVVAYLNKNNIKTINFVVIRSTWYKLANVVLSPLKKENIKVDYLGFDFLRTNNGLRKKKLRRL